MPHLHNKEENTIHDFIIEFDKWNIYYKGEKVVDPQVYNIEGKNGWEVQSSEGKKLVSIFGNSKILEPDVSIVRKDLST